MKSDAQKTSVRQVGAQELGARARIHIQGSQTLGITPVGIHWVHIVQTPTESIGGPRTLMVRIPKQPNGTASRHNTEVNKLVLNNGLSRQGWPLGFHSNHVTTFTSPPLSSPDPQEPWNSKQRWVS